jgi:hypothetical protein
MNFRPYALVLVASLLAACGGASSDSSGNPDDLRRRRDGGAHDGGSHDGGSHDGGVHDGGSDGGADAGTDAGTPGTDGGTPGTDGGTPGTDAGTPPGGACSSNDDCTNGGLCSSGACVASACNQRHAGVTGIRAMVRIDQYLGLVNGRNGTHELANGTLQSVSWIYQASVEDTTAAQLAMNVASSTDPRGLPQEIPISPGQVIEVEGEYIPAATANASGRAVIHFTHLPCGYVTVNGTTY